MVSDKILLAREERRKKIIAIAKGSDVVTLKANVPGDNKSLIEAHLLVKYFINKVLTLGTSLVDIDIGEDGITAFFTTENGEEVKRKAIVLEETHPLGRLIDIDVTLKGREESCSRGKMRKCFLCDREAFVCGREKTHSAVELLRFFVDKTNEHISFLIEKVIEESMLEELNLENKFGLVTPSSNGSHKDLNYKIMRNAIDEIKLPLSKAFFLGVREEDFHKLMDKLIPIGLECERAMLKVTDGANAYKGFIFVGGLLLASFGYTVKKGERAEDVYLNARKIAENFSFPTNTFGADFYKKGFGGVRGETLRGFPMVKDAESLLGKKTLHSVLEYIVSKLEDSVLYKRAKGDKGYEYFKNLIANAHEREELVTKECIENNISIGGSADVLIASCMVKKLKEIFYLR